MVEMSSPQRWISCGSSRSHQGAFCCVMEAEPRSSWDQVLSAELGPWDQVLSAELEPWDQVPSAELGPWDHVTSAEVGPWELWDLPN